MLKTEQTMKESTSELALDETTELRVRGYVYKRGREDIHSLHLITCLHDGSHRREHAVFDEFCEVQLADNIMHDGVEAEATW
jgi:hypothetical protein